MDYHSSILWGGLLYGCGIAVLPFLYEDITTDRSDQTFIFDLALLVSGFHFGDLLGKLFAYCFSACLSYYSTSFVDFFSLVALVCFGFSFNLSWLYASRICIGFMSGILAKAACSKGSYFAKLGVFELSFGLGAFVFSALYWSTVKILLTDSSAFIDFFENHPASIGSLFSASLLLVGYMVLYIHRKLISETTRRGYEVIAEEGRFI